MKKTVTVGKSRKVTSLGRIKETWVKAELTAEFDEGKEPDLADIRDLLLDVETILEMEEADERRYWNTPKN